MKLHLRLALPLFGVAVAVTLAGMIGAIVLISRTSAVGLNMQEKQVSRVVESLLTVRQGEVESVATVLAILDGSVGDRLASWEHMPVDSAVVLDTKTGRVISSWGASVEGDDLSKLPASLNFSPLLVRSRGGVLVASARPDKTNPGRLVVVAVRVKVDTANRLKQLLQGEVTLSVDGRESLSTAGKLRKSSALESGFTTPGGGAVMFRIFVPLEELHRERRNALALVIAGGLVLLVSALLFYNWILARVTRPIRELAVATSRVATGEQATKLPAGAPGELGELVKRFNDMAGRLREAQERLVHSAKLTTVGQMTAGISHELNNPLTGLIMHAESQVSKLPKGKPGRAEAEVILGEAQRMKRILGNLRDMAKPGTGKKSRMDLNSMVKDAFAFIQHQARRANVEIRTELASGRLMVDAVPDQIRQVLLNLALNAIEAMPGGGKMVISTRPEKGKALVCVRDSGRGISGENMRKVMEPFFTTKPGRIGLGLAISSEAAQRHGGKLSLEKASGRGTIACLELPVAGGKS